MSARRAILGLVLAAGLAALLPATGSGTSGPLRGHVTSTSLYSPALGRREHVLVYTPPGYASHPTRRFPVMILLHGVPGRPEDFVDHGFIARVDGLIVSGAIRPVIVALPAGSDHPEDDNEWADSEVNSGQRWETYLANDLVRWLDRGYRTTRRRAIGGVSMGGFGAMNVALHHRNEFAAVGSWSGYFNANTPTVHDPGSFAWKVYSPQLYAPALKPALRLLHPQISFYVGSRDGFAAENVAFDRLLTRLHVPHRFALVRGAGHGWALWTSRADAELRFLAGGLGS